MRTFSLHLHSYAGYEYFDDVLSFIGEDQSGSFGLMAGHQRFMTEVVFGLARFRCVDQDWEYLAQPGSMLYFRNNNLYLNTRRYQRHSDLKKILALLESDIKAEEASLHSVKQSLHQIDEEMLRRLWELHRSGGANV